ncbi:MAG: glycerophosphodiester phosphodiesterase [Clostridia bacterium]|nr:glycerophosphodiester phosphodiesterase [Clostridia bacterium]
MDTYKNAVRVAAHRGNSKYYPENTLIGFQSALQLPVDQLEIDLHMCKDGHIVMMHDHTVDRTTNGTGRVRDLTLEELKALDAGSWKGEQFAGTQIPTFIEFLEMLKDYPEMTVNVELKDYPREDPEWARISADKSIALIEEYGIADRIWINCWSGELLEYIDEKYNHRYRLHGYFPYELMHGEWSRDPLSYMHCLCLFGHKLPHPVRPKADFDFVAAADVEPWCYFPGDEEEYYDGAIANGVKLLTCNDPKKALDYLRRRGLHE